MESGPGERNGGEGDGVCVGECHWPWSTPSGVSIEVGGIGVETIPQMWTFWDLPE